MFFYFYFVAVIKISAYLRALRPQWGKGSAVRFLIYCSPEVKFSDAFGIFEKKNIVLCHLELNFEVYV